MVRFLLEQFQRKKKNKFQTLRFQKIRLFIRIAADSSDVFAEEKEQEIKS